MPACSSQRAPPRWEGIAVRSEASLTSPFARLGAWIARRTKWVLAASVVAIVAMGVYGASVEDHLPAGGLDVPGSESALAAQEAARRFGIGAADVLVLYRNPDGDVLDAEFGSRVIDSLDAVLADAGVVGATTVYDTSQKSLVSRDGRETLVIVSLAGDSAKKLATFRRIEPSLRAIEPPAEVVIGGIVAFTLLVQQAAREDAADAEMIALPFALLLTLVFFRGAVAALLPIAIGAFSLAGSAAFVRFGAQFTEISIFAMSVGAFLGLGLSIDYALLLVQRFREEIGGDSDVEDAVAATLDTAGRAVWVSGLTVVTSLLALLFVPLPVLRSVAIGGALVVVSALLGALLVLPALLAWLGPNVNRWPIGRAHQEGEPSPFWLRVGGLSMRHPLLTVIGCLVVLAMLAAPVLRMKSAMPDTAVLARDSEARVIDEALADPQRFDPGGASAIPVIVEVDGSPLDPANLRTLRTFIAAIEAVPGVAGVRSALRDLDPDALTPDAMQRKIVSEPTATQLRRMTDTDAVLLIADNRNPWRSPESALIVQAIRAVPQDGVRAMVGGATAQMVDQVKTLRSYGGIAALLVALSNFVILLVAFRSVIVPLKAVLMNALSLCASYGLLVWVFQDGHFASFLGFRPAADGIDPTIPLVMFAVVFGLSMDYEVFLLSRIQEEWKRTRNNQQSVILGLARTGRTITSAALILLVVVGAFMTGDLVYVKQMGLGIVAAIALDATLVRTLLVPATMQLLGDWNWWAPRWLRAR
jgi:RND superfamily putative drug exporter